MPAVSGTIYDSAANPVGGRIVRAYRRDSGFLLAAGTTGTGSVVAGDASYASVGLLMRFVGENFSASFLDESSTPLTATVLNAYIRGGQSYWGTTSGHFGASGSTSYVSYPHAAQVAVATGDFTVEGWFRPAALGQSFLISKRVSTGHAPYSMQLGSDGKFAVLTSTASPAATTLTGTTVITLNTWYHVAFVRNGSAFTLYVNGVAEATHTSADNRYDAAEAVIVGASSASTQAYFGHMNSVRITKLARYTANFTPHTTEFHAVTTYPAVTLGQYSLDLAGYAGEVNVVALDDVAAPLENDLILRTTGV